MFNSLAIFQRPCNYECFQFPVKIQWNSTQFLKLNLSHCLRHSLKNNAMRNSRINWRLMWAWFSKLKSVDEIICCLYVSSIANWFYMWNIFETCKMCCKIVKVLHWSMQYMLLQLEISFNSNYTFDAVFFLWLPVS